MYYKEILGAAQHNTLFNTTTIMNEFPSPTSLITPNTMKTIEESILASLEGTGNSSIIASAATGSFVPPLPSSSSSTITLVQTWQGGQVDTQQSCSNYSSDCEEEEKPVAKRQKTTKKSGGGRKPRSVNENPEEEQRRRVRRERNKLAAARCRKRRVDHTNLLIGETEELESKRRSLQDEIQRWQCTKEDLEFVLEAHMPTCCAHAQSQLSSRLVIIKRENESPPPSQFTADEPHTNTYLNHVTHSNNAHALNVHPHVPVTTHVTAPAPITHVTPKAQRPTSLRMCSNPDPGIPISTPSNGLISFGDIDWSELPSTGLTPTAVNTGNIGLVTPLVTPSTANSILMSLQNSNNQKFVSL